jgi:hypothetical protein
MFGWTELARKLVVDGCVAESERVAPDRPALAWRSPEKVRSQFLSLGQR